jgi:hypothetical protein
MTRRSVVERGASGFGDSVIQKCPSGAERERGTLRGAMVDDEFGKVTRAGLVHLAIGSVGLLTPVIGPVLVVVFAACLRTAVERIAARRAAGEEAMASLEVSLLQDDVRALRDELSKRSNERAAQGKTPEQPHPSTAERIFADFFEAAAEETSPAKRLAIVRATASRLDSDGTSSASKTYWFQRLRSLPELELELVLRVAPLGRGAVFLIDRGGIQVVDSIAVPPKPGEVGTTSNLRIMTTIALSMSDAVAYAEAAERLIAQGPNQFLRVLEGMAGGLSLLDNAHEIARIASTVGESPPAHAAG